MLIYAYIILHMIFIGIKELNKFHKIYLVIEYDEIYKFSALIY